MPLSVSTDCVQKRALDSLVANECMLGTAQQSLSVINSGGFKFWISAMDFNTLFS